MWSARLVTLLTLLLLFAFGAMVSSQEAGPGDVIDPALLPLLGDTSSVPVVVYLQNQPLWEIAREVQAARLPQIRALERQARAIAMRHRSDRAFYGTEDERGEARRERAALTAADKRELRALGKRISRLLDLMKQEIGVRMRHAVFAEQKWLARQIRLLGGEVIYEFTIENAVAVRIPGTAIAAIAELPEVAYVDLDRMGIGLLDVSLPSIYAATFHSAGETGGTYRPAICDTGVDTGHPALSGHTWTSQVFHASGKLQGNYADNSTSTDDLHGHGSHVSGIILSTDSTYTGVAYGSTRALNLKAGYLTTGGGNSMMWSDARAAVHWAIVTCSYPPHAVNFSFGDNTYLGQGDTNFARFWDAVVDAKATPVAIAAGNSGPSDKTINDPAGAYNILCVANMDDANTTDRSDDTIRNSSSRGPVGTNNRKKPDITAPGTNILSCNNDWETEDDFVSMTGTSMAAPHVVGAMTLLADVGVTDPKEQKALIVNTAEDWGTAGWDKTYGWGYIDLDHLYFHHADVFQDSVKPTSDPDNCYDLYRVTGMTTGEKATLVWNRHVLYNNANNPVTWYALNNLNMHLYKEDDGSLVQANAGTADNVEQVKADQDATFVIRVDTPSASFNGVTEESYALATEEGASKVNPPTAILKVEGGWYQYPPLNAKFKLRARLQNTGGVPAFNCRIELGTLPAGLQKIAGADTQMLGQAPAAGYSAWAEWTLKATTTGSKTVNLDSYGYGYGLTLTDSGTVTVVPGAEDTVKPETIALLDEPAVLSGGTEKVSNGGFESDWSGWTTSGSVSISTTEYHGGAKSARAGGTGSGSFYQDVALSAGANQIILQFWYKTLSWGIGSQRAQIRNTSGDALWALVNENSTHDWQQLSVDLTQYKGTTVRIFFYATGDGFFLPAYIWADDVTVKEDPNFYVGQITPWRLLAKDDRAGVDYSEYRIDGGGWNTGSQFTLSGRSEGPHTVDYRSVDNSGNTEDLHTVTPDVDNTAPMTAAKLGSFVAGNEDNVVNGGFEYGSDLYGWVRSGLTGVSTSVYHSGSKSALVAGQMLGGTIYQDIAIAGGATNAAISLWYRPTSSAVMGTPGLQRILLQDTSNTTLETLYSGRQNSASFTHLAVDVTRFRGQTIRLKFTVGNSTMLASSGLFVDDVSLLEDPTVYLSSSSEVTFAARDLKSGVQYTEYQIDGGGWLSSTPFTISGGDHILSYRSVDKVDNVEATTDLPLRVDAGVPDGTIVIGYGLISTGSRDVPLSLSATSDVTQMRFKNEVGDWSSWVAYADTYSWTLTAGQGTKTVYAEFRNASLNVSPQRYDTITHTIPSQAEVGESKGLLDGTIVTLFGKLGSASFAPSGMFYVQEPDRSAGIRVVWTGAITPGDVLEVVGALGTIDGEKVLQASTVSYMGGGPPPVPILVRNADVGGGDFAYQENPPAGQKGVLGGTGLNNVGLLLTTSGWVTPGGATWIYVDDGSTDSGLKVDCTYLTAMPPPDTFIVITGVCGVEPSGQDLIPVLRPRGDADIGTTYPAP